MEKCKHCNKNLTNGIMLTCPTCGALMCPSCANGTQMICPYCYSTLDYFI
ncbi:MAG: hypothetical protein IJQ07_06150 [Clostridia bacterium]|nr:hypothetical protein [Clostridia bacterium]